jgi:hypothetical protein
MINRYGKREEETYEKMKKETLMNTVDARSSITLSTGSGVHPASYPMGTRGSFTGSKTVGA